MNSASRSISSIAGAFVLGVCLVAALGAQENPPAENVKRASVPVQFVGCKSDGQIGPQDAPKLESKPIALASDLAQRLAFYEAEDGPGVLAPKGWYCFGIYGSNGATLFVSPEPITSANLFSDRWNGFAGPVIQISLSVGDTSGRFEVAKEIARVFPDYAAFVKGVIAEGIVPASSFPSGPYPGDRIKRRSKTIVEFETPANAEGLGTDSRLLKNGSLICGMLRLVGEEPNLVHLSLRLPAANADLTKAIIEHAEHETY